MTDVRVLAFGGCNVRAPLVRALHRRSLRDPSAWREAPGGYRVSGPPFFTYTTGEMLQAIAGWRGERTIPEELLALCNMRPSTAPTPARSPLGQVDVALIEPNTSVEIVVGDVFINRRPLQQLMAPLRELGGEAAKLSARWFEKGIAGMDAAARTETTEALLPLVPEDAQRAELIVRVLREAVSFAPPVRPGLERLVEALGVPVGVAGFTWAYMPDGRGLSWPTGFHAEITRAAAELGLPFFEPRELVLKTGVANAIEKDLRHYSDSFLPVVAGPLVEFVLSIAERWRERPPVGLARPAAA